MIIIAVCKCTTTLRVSWPSRRTLCPCLAPQITATSNGQWQSQINNPYSWIWKWNRQKVKKTRTHTHTHIYIYRYIYTCTKFHWILNRITVKSNTSGFKRQYPTLTITRVKQVTKAYATLRSAYQSIYPPDSPGLQPFHRHGLFIRQGGCLKMKNSTKVSRNHIKSPHLVG